MSSHKIILGSQSSARQRILKRARFEFVVRSADIDEKAIRHDDLDQLVVLVAQAKADALLPDLEPPGLLITADSVVECNGQLYEKPIDAEQARMFMRSYGSYPAHTITAVVVTDIETRRQVFGVDKTTLVFNPIPEEIIESLIAEGQVMHCAGAFMIENEERLSGLVKSIDGDLDSVEGMPMRLLYQLLSQTQVLSC